MKDRLALIIIFVILLLVYLFTPNICKYKDIFGKPGEGIHSIRIFGFALVDIALTILAAAVATKFTRIGKRMGFLETTLILFLLGIAFHFIFCVDTKLNRYLGLVRKNT